MHLKPKQIPLVVFYASLFVLGCGIVFARDLGPFFVVMALGAAVLIAAGSGLFLLGQALYERSRQSWLRVAIAALVVLAGYFGITPLSHGVEYAQFTYRRARLEALVYDVLKDGRVRSMSDARRFFKDLNGIHLRDVGPPVDAGSEQGPLDAVPLSVALARTGIDEPAYRHFRAALLSTGYLEVEVAPGYVAFVEDGMLDNLFGVVYVRPGNTPPPLGSEFVDGTELVALRHLSGPWYSFGTT
jgi:hypothetical protein